MNELRDNGDLVLFAVNGDPLARFQADGRFLQVNTNGPVGEGYGDHPLNTRAEQLTEEDVRAIRDWCEANRA